MNLSDSISPLIDEWASIAKPKLIDNGVTQLIINLGFSFIRSNEVLNNPMVCTSSVPKVERPKAQLKEHTFDKGFKLKHCQ